MNRWPFLVLACFLLSADISYAAGMLMRVQQMKRAKQMQSQGVTPEEYQKLQQQNGQGQAQQPAPPTYQQTIDQRNQAIAQAILDAHNRSVTTADALTGESTDADQTPQAPTAPAPSKNPAVEQVENQPNQAQVVGNIQDVVDLSEVWKKLDKKSTVWTILADEQSKALTVSEYIDRFRKKGVKINNPPMHYVQMIDGVVGQNANMLNMPFGQVLRVMAIVEYDFDNGSDKDALAKQVLGEAGYEANKKRFSQ